MIHHLTDSDPKPWLAERRPDPTTEELNLLGLAKLYADADRAVQCRAGTVSREVYQGLTDRRLELKTALLAAAAAYRGRA